MRIWQVGLLGLALGVGAVRAQEPVAVGEEFQINTYTTDYQIETSVAVADEGDFVVVWQSGGDYYSAPLSIQGQLYDASGSPVGEEFQINSFTTGAPWSPAVAVQPQGDFVVAWSGPEIHGQRFDSDGTPQGGQFQVNTFTTSGQGVPAVATDTEGDFVVVWQSGGSYGTDTDEWSIQGQRYAADGTPAGEQFQVNTFTTSGQRKPAVATDTEGDFVVVWASGNSYGDGPDGSWSGVQAQRYDAAGNPVGSEFQVNSYTTQSQYYPGVAIDSQGNFVVVWASQGSYGTDTSDVSIQAQRYDASGNPVGSEFQVNSYTSDHQGVPAVAGQPQGEFIVTWTSYGQDGSARGIFGQQFASDGSAVGGEFQVNTYTTGQQERSSVGADSDGNFVVVWESFGDVGQDSDFSIQGQRFGGPHWISYDGFESGDTSAWSSTVQ